MRILLSHFVHPDDGLEREAVGGRAELIVQPLARGTWASLPSEVKASADAIIHFPPNTSVDGSPRDYPRVRALVRSGVGFDAIDIAAWGEAGVAVFNVPDYGTSEVADHAIALMLALSRGTATYHDALRSDPERGWNHLAAPAVRRLRDAVFGIVGLGRIGLAAAMRARGFGMRIAFFDPYLPSGMEIAVGAHRCSSLAELMALSDVLSVHAPANEETQGLIGTAAFAQAKPGMVLVNTARGSIVDLDAIYKALREDRILAAGLDVLPKEPADPVHPLFVAWRNREPWLEGRLTLSPHAAFYSPASLRDMRTKGVETALRHLETGELANCVNRSFLKARS
jgi:D-3-phosphoglycerate dehydrogenase/C-terminal binding protein